MPVHGDACGAEQHRYGKRNMEYAMEQNAWIWMQKYGNSRGGTYTIWDLVCDILGASLRVCRIKPFGFYQVWTIGFLFIFVLLPEYPFLFFNEI